MSDIALVTCKLLPEPDPDQEPLLAACRDAGLSVEMAAWDDPDVDWSRFRFAKLHSCWNYYEEPVAFGHWVESAASQTTLWNPPRQVQRNLDKHYLGQLERLGIPIVPTQYLNADFNLLEALDNVDWERFVIKPTVSAASFMTKRFTRDDIDEAQEFVCEILETREAMVQPYVDSVDRGGEVAAVHIDGELTHCVVKQPRFAGNDESVSVSFQPDVAIADAAQVVMASVKGPWLYARVDLMQGEDGRWLLSELELIEPTLFLAQHAPALDRLVGAMARLTA